MRYPATVHLLEPVLWIKNVLTAILIRLSIFMPIWIRGSGFYFYADADPAFYFDVDLD